MPPAEDARRVEAARRAAGPDFVLAVDANCAWSVDEAVCFARLVEPLDIPWFQGPCHLYDHAAMMARGRPQTPIPLTPGQSQITHHSAGRPPAGRPRRLLDT